MIQLQIFRMQQHNALNSKQEQNHHRKTIENCLLTIYVDFEEARRFQAGEADTCPNSMLTCKNKTNKFIHSSNYQINPQAYVFSNIAPNRSTKTDRPLIFSDCFKAPTIS